MTEAEFEAAVARIRSGDREGLKEIYLAYVKFIYSVIYNIVGNKETTEDLTSDVFIKLWDVLEQYKPGHGHKGYLATIARNHAIDHMRRAGREIPIATGGNEEYGADNGNDTSQVTAFDTGGDYAPARQETPEEAVVGDMSVEHALATLSPEEREVIERKVLADMTFKEISEELKVPMGTITWRYQAAIKKLRRCGYE
ncbi:MAG: RNA polymerase sigma factor [Lachnospiraceae bacterium]|nr:RNA polymerase sigma factor [Candidatus Merdinaster equi]